MGRATSDDVSGMGVTQLIGVVPVAKRCPALRKGYVVRAERPNCYIRVSKA